MVGQLSWVSLSFVKMPPKRKLVVKTLAEKCKALKDLEKGMSSKEVAEKYGVPKNTLSTWLKQGKALHFLWKVFKQEKKNQKW